MKTTQMTVEGAKGWANITRREAAGNMVIAIHGDGAAGLFGFSADTRDERSQQYAAARLQRELDGCQGTAGDVADHLRPIQMLADQPRKGHAMKKAPNRCEYRIKYDDWYATQVERSIHIIDRASGKTIKAIRPPAA
jgi:hypothetical protein